MILSRANDDLAGKKEMCKKKENAFKHSLKLREGGGNCNEAIKFYCEPIKNIFNQNVLLLTNFFFMVYDCTTISIKPPDTDQ